MRAYNPQWIYNREVNRQAERWHRQGLITNEQLAAIQQSYPAGFRQTNGILEIGLFLFTTLAVLGTFLLIVTVVAGVADERPAFGLFSLAFGVGLTLFGRHTINRRMLYRNGVDNAFAVLSTGFLTFGLLLFLPENMTVAAYSLAALPLLLLGLWYYGDTILAFLAMATFYTGVFDGMLEVSWGKDALPFVLMAVSALLYSFVSKIERRTPNEVYYADPLNLVESLSLVVLAASGNYFVVRELNALLLSPIPADAPQIAMPALFWLLTFLIPGAYLWYGFRTRNRILASLGGIGMIAAVATVHHYAQLLRLNVALTLGGLALIGISVFIIRYLKTGTPDRPKHGFTDLPDEESPDHLFGNAETLTAVQAAAGTQQAPKDNLRFGGGNFGGAGSEGRY